MRIDITKQGAVGDGKSVNTEAIQKAVDLCHENGGGTVVIPAGVFVSGTFFLKSNVTLEVTAGAVLQASEKIGDYREDVHHNRYRNEMSLDRLLHPDGMGSENYYPDWSRTAFMDIRNVEDLYLSNIRLSIIRPDEREAVLTEGCTVLKREVFIGQN